MSGNPDYQEFLTLLHLYDQFSKFNSVSCGSIHYADQAGVPLAEWDRLLSRTKTQIIKDIGSYMSRVAGYSAVRDQQIE